MPEENVEIVRRSIDAFNRGDIDEALIDYAPEAEWHTSGRFADLGIYRGRSGLKQLWAEVQEDMEGLSLSITDIRAVGADRVFVAEVATGRGKRGKARYEQRIWYVVTFRDRLITRVETYFDSVQALEAAGLSE
jgi:ketosteroid isomerase-like protein